MKINIAMLSTVVLLSYASAAVANASLDERQDRANQLLRGISTPIGPGVQYSIVNKEGVGYYHQ